MNKEQIFESLLNSKEQISLTDLVSLWDSLEPINEDFMIGEWEGGVFNTGHRGEKHLTALNWVGKNFHDRNNVDPIISKDQEGKIFANNVLGSASCRMVEYRNQSTATMVYDNHPIFDHFKKINETIVLGIMDRKGEEVPLWFYLKRRV